MYYNYFLWGPVHILFQLRILSSIYLRYACSIPKLELAYIFLSLAENTLGNKPLNSDFWIQGISKYKSQNLYFENDSKSTISLLYMLKKLVIGKFKEMSRFYNNRTLLWKNKTNLIGFLLLFQMRSTVSRTKKCKIL